ncbi:MAG: phosphohydrolase [Tannerellaceae bacterium]|jgi:uncharacterized protein|nr:phosphohydrolase [Tannerellaceae bacterium]
MNPNKIIAEYYPEGSKARKILVRHGEDVAGKALQIAALHPEMLLDLRFIEEAAMLHDIGIFLCNEPEFHCFGAAEYICHGYLGADLLRGKGLHRHALVCERHTGAGITIDEIVLRNLPLPFRNMLPLSLEEKIICYADKFFSKTKPGKEKALEKVLKSLSKHGRDTLERFMQMHYLFYGERLDYME